MTCSFADESEIIQTVGPDFDLSQEVAAAPDEEEIIPVADSISGTEEDIPLSLDNMTPEDIISAITEEKAEEAAPAETTEEIREQAQAILEAAEKKLAAVTAMQEEEAAKLAEAAANTAETAAENVPEPIKAEETPSEVRSGKKHYRKKKHKRSANNKNSASDNDNGGAV